MILSSFVFVLPSVLYLYLRTNAFGSTFNIDIMKGSIELKDLEDSFNDKTSISESDKTYALFFVLFFEGSLVMTMLPKCRIADW